MVAWSLSAYGDDNHRYIKLRGLRVFTKSSESHLLFVIFTLPTCSSRELFRKHIVAHFCMSVMSKIKLFLIPKTHEFYSQVKDLIQIIHFHSCGETISSFN